MRSKRLLFVESLLLITIMLREMAAHVAQNQEISSLNAVI